MDCKVIMIILTLELFLKRILKISLLVRNLGLNMILQPLADFQGTQQVRASLSLFKQLFKNLPFVKVFFFATPPPLHFEQEKS